MPPEDIICRLTDQTSHDAYKLLKADMPIDDERVHSLAEILEHRCPFDMGFRPRLTLAYEVVYWFLKLFATPWLNGAAISTSIRLPVSSNGQRLLYDQAFFLATFQITPVTTQPTNETFVSLGVLLLELCFNKTIEQHPRWPTNTGSVPLSLLRKAIALEWAQNVEEQWPQEGCDAINWCLQYVPPQDDKWREDFASNVVEPIKTICINSGLNVR